MPIRFTELLAKTSFLANSMQFNFLSFTNYLMIDFKNFEIETTLILRVPLVASGYLQSPP